MSESFGIRLALLDGQLVDRDRLPLGRVDDLELSIGGPGEQPEIESVLTGSEALGDRIDGSLGRWMSSVSRRLRRRAAPPGPSSIDPAHIVELEPLIKLSVAAEELPEVGGLEKWLASNFVERLPGTGDASE